MEGLLKTIYTNSPTFLQNLGVSLYGLKVRIREYGRKFDLLLREFDDHLSWSRDQLLEYQDEQIRSLIAHCYERIPYYREIMRERKLTPADIKTGSDLQKLPILTRSMVRSLGDRLVATNMKPSELVVGHTSGTTGSPLRLVWDENVCLMKTVVDWRQKKIAGIRPGEKMALFLGRQVAPLDQKKPPFWRHNWALNQLFCSSFHLSNANLGYYFDKLRKFEPVALEGYPSTMSILAGYLNSRSETFPLRAIFTSSETLLPSQREEIEQAFGCRVFDFYGMAERIIFATECGSQHAKHLNIDFGHVEIGGARSCQAGEPIGRIVATGLHNYAMPLIRYETSDISSISKETCPCGCALPIMNGVASKDEDIVITPDGRYISSSILNAVTHHLTNVAESQIVQNDKATVIFRLVRRPEFSDADAKFIRDSMREVLGSEVTLNLEFVESIPRTEAGKFRWVISKVPLGF